jgi:hypothetical protein
MLAGRGDTTGIQGETVGSDSVTVSAVLPGCVAPPAALLSCSWGLVTDMK